ncbi:P-loop containing nucleoside triphosphate hydrolase protein [Aulographum hederae CBS 113979]|uniref:P-loop containing nucleoside triphosphate hydrolase protein n=1 Tax=Aulographum hederae CBS 113979 TaxID=1176131 RepID=A0A6G1GL82_9PEZI|nr:P-loop containing nucleoside triphosphate hydrolase protein [Aulographum hederae CBS 113979]
MGNSNAPAMENSDATAADVGLGLFMQQVVEAANEGSQVTPGNAPDRRQSRSSSSDTLPSVDEALMANTKEYIAAIDGLTKCGVSTDQLELPSVVIIGDQSAGKSSLTEALSGFKVPRDSGTCTRCVLRITTKEAETVKIQIHYQKKYNYFGPFDPNHDSTDDSECYPWFKNAQDEVHDLGVFFDIDQMEHVVRAAQVLALTPATLPTPSYFRKLLSLPSTELKASQLEVEFSPNVICVEISGPGKTNLSFYDLPGIIAQVEDRKKNYLVKLVRNLNKEYIKNSNAIVLIACSLESDLDNCKAAALAQELGAGDRSMSVLTKPDRLPAHSPPEHLAAVLDGKRFPLKHGYFVVRLPSQAELNEGITYVMARKNEEDFFKSEKPWASNFKPYSELFGIPNLLTSLSKKLGAHIAASLPGIEINIAQRLGEINELLKRLPEPPTGNARAIVRKLIDSFADEMEKEMRDDFPPTELLKRIKQFEDEFVQELLQKMLPGSTLSGQKDRRDKPANLFRNLQSSPRTPSKRADQPFGPIETIDLESDSAADASAPAPVVSPSPNKKRKREQDAGTRPGPRAGAWKSELASSFNLDDLQRALHESTTTGLPGNVDPRAVTSLILECLNHWEKPVDQLLHEVQNALQDIVIATLDFKLKEWKDTDLFRQTWKISQDFTNSLLQVQEVAIKRALRIERTAPITKNEQAYEYHLQKETELLKAKRFEKRAREIMEAMCKRLGRDISQHEKERKLREIRQELGPDPYTRELETLAKIRAYYNIAGSRFVDTVCMSFKGEFMASFRTEFKDNLHKAFDLDEDGAQNRCILLLAEDADRAQRRIFTQREKERLVAAQDCFIKCHANLVPNATSGPSG